MSLSCLCSRFSTRLQGWVNERRLATEPDGARVLLVQPGDPAAHLEKARACVPVCLEASMLWL
jgi:hypothetical protein